MSTNPEPTDDLRWEDVTCAKCGETHQCTPWFDFYETPLWDGEGRVCEQCFRVLMYTQARVGKSVTYIIGGAR